MSFLEHLEDLRKRLIYSCLALAAGMAIAFPFMDQLVSFVFAPAWAVLPAGTDLIFSRPTEGISISFDIALMAGLVLASPVVMYQVWLFIAPALYANEKRFAIPFVTLSAVGSVAGAAFSHYLLFPAMMSFVATFTPGELTFLPRAEYVFELYVRSLIGMVLVFQIPTLAFFLARMRLVTARFLLRHLKHAFLLVLIAAAILTPSPDPWNMAIFAAPMFGLYLIGIGIAWLAQPKRRADSTALRLVFTAAALDHACRRQARPRFQL